MPLSHVHGVRRETCTNTEEMNATSVHCMQGKDGRVSHHCFGLEDVHWIPSEIVLAKSHVPICATVTNLRGETAWCGSRLVVASNKVNQEDVKHGWHDGDVLIRVEDFHLVLCQIGGTGRVCLVRVCIASRVVSSVSSKTQSTTYSPHWDCFPKRTRNHRAEGLH
jgi:hypothetical protein